MTNPTDNLPPIRPGAFIQGVLDVGGLSRSQFAELIGVPADVASRLLDGTIPLDADMASRLSEWLGTSVQFWLNLQANHDRKKSCLDNQKM